MKAVELSLHPSSLMGFMTLTAVQEDSQSLLAIHSSSTHTHYRSGCSNNKGCSNIKNLKGPVLFFRHVLIEPYVLHSDKCVRIIKTSGLKQEEGSYPEYLFVDKV